MNWDSSLPKDWEGTEAAAVWWIRLQNDEAAVFSPEFQEWISVAANEREFQAIERAAHLPVQLMAASSIAEMRHAARSRFERNKEKSDNWAHRPMAWAAAAAVLISVCGAGYLWSVRQPSSYEAAMGGRRSVALEDGSRILLDSDSAVAIRYSKTARAVTLTRGQARFDVAHDTSRPFSVSVGTETVTAVGTSFDVELRGSKVLVTLIKGRIIVRDTSDRGKQTNSSVKLSAGQQLIASIDSRPIITSADFAVTQAWEAGHLVFRGEDLADAVEQINRHTSNRITVDPSAASFRVIGVFNVGDTKSFISVTTELYPIEAVTSEDGAITLRRRS
jgi:transmembrane sensor